MGKDNVAQIFGEMWDMAEEKAQMVIDENPDKEDDDFLK